MRPVEEILDMIRTMRERVREGFTPLMKPLPLLVLGGVIGLFLLTFTGGYAADTLARLLDLFGIYGGNYEQAALDTARAMSYAISCSAISHSWTVGEGQSFSGLQQTMRTDMEDTWNNGPTTPKVDKPCEEATKDGGAKIGPTNVVVKCADLGHNNPWCDVINATLPQPFSDNNAGEWITGNGLPRYMLYYQALGREVQNDYLVVQKDFKMWGVAIAAGAALIPVAGSALGSGARAGASFLRSRASLRLFGGILSSADDAARATAASLRSIGSKAVRSFMDEAAVSGQYGWRMTKSATQLAIEAGRRTGVASRFASRLNVMMDNVVRNSDEGLGVFKSQADVRAVVDDASRAAAQGEDFAHALPPEGREAFAQRIWRDIQAARGIADDFAVDGATPALKEGTERFALRSIGASDDLLGTLFRGSSDEVTENLNSWLSNAENIFSGAPRISKQTLAKGAREVACRGFATRLATARVATDAIEPVLDDYTPGDDWIDDTAGCAAFSGVASSGFQRVCSAVGVSNVPSISAGLGGTGACTVATAVGVTAMQASNRAIPTQAGRVNSLYLQRPFTSPIEYPLNKYAAWYFVRSKRGGSSDTRFHMMSPLYTAPDELQTANNPRIVIDFDSTSVTYKSSHMSNLGPGKRQNELCTGLRGLAGFADLINIFSGGEPLFWNEIVGADAPPFKVPYQNVSKWGFRGGMIWSTGCGPTGVACHPCEPLQNWLLPNAMVDKAVAAADEDGDIFHPTRPPGASSDMWGNRIMMREAADPNWTGNSNGVTFEQLSEPPVLTQQSDGDWVAANPYKTVSHKWGVGAEIYSKGQFLQDIDLGRTFSRQIPVLDVTFQGMGGDLRVKDEVASHNYGWQGSEHEQSTWETIFMVGPIILDGAILAAGAILSPVSGGGSAAVAFAASSAIYSGAAEVARQGIGLDHAWPCHRNGCQSVLQPWE